MRLKGQVAIVTGAARGLGAASAGELARQGAHVMLTDILPEVQVTAEHLSAEGFSVSAEHHDVTRENDWDEIVRKTCKKFGDIQVLVNNAGINLPGTIDDVGIDDVKKVMEVNYFGAFRGIKAVLPSMRKKGRGSIINLSSNSTRMILSLTTPYAPAKAALALLTKNVAVHCGPENIRCNSVHPGPHETAMLLGDGPNAAGDAAVNLIKPMIDAIPMRRMGKPEDVGKLVAFLASDDSGYINGAELFIDGGLSLL